MIGDSQKKKAAGALLPHRPQQGGRGYRRTTLNALKEAHRGRLGKRWLARRRWGRAVPVGLVARSLLGRLQQLYA